MVEGGTNPSLEMLRESLEYTPTWVVAAVCSIIVFISLLVERFIHYLGKFLKHKNQHAVFEALQKLKEELMLLGFISLLLTVFQNRISQICIPESITFHMLPCKLPEGSDVGQESHSHGTFSVEHNWRRRRLLSGGSNSAHCKQGKVPLLSLEALHHLHIFIFVLAVVHVIFCATTMVLGGMKIREWKHWEVSIRASIRNEVEAPAKGVHHMHHHKLFIKEYASGFWRKSFVVSWMMSFLKQFYASVTKTDYTALRSGFITTHCRGSPDFDFHKYMMRALQSDFRRVVGISWYLWLFVVIFLLLNIDGWHTYFWLSFLPLILLLTVGAKLEHIITRLATEAVETHGEIRIKPSDKHFWFDKPGMVLYLIHFILFQNSFELAFFFWIWSTFGFDSCIMEKVGYIIPRLIIGVLIQGLCSYSTLPLYAIVTQMGSMFKREIFNEQMHFSLHEWAKDARSKKKTDHGLLKMFGFKKKKNEPSSSTSDNQAQKMVVTDSSGRANNATKAVALQEIITSGAAGEHSNSGQAEQSS